MYPDDSDWQQLCQQLRDAVTLATLVLTAWKMGLWIARSIVEQQLTERGKREDEQSYCSVCKTPLLSKGFAERQMLTLVGKVHWKRRIRRCPRHCLNSQKVPSDDALGIVAHQQTSIELVRLGCLLAVFLPFELAASILQQSSGISVSDGTIWNWIQAFGQRAEIHINNQLQDANAGKTVQIEALDSTLEAMPLIIAADGVTVPFRPQPKTAKGKIVWREVKVALLARLGKHQTQAGENVTRLYQRRFVAVLGSIDDLKPRLQLEAKRQGVETAPQVAWISDGARGFWRLYQDCFADCAIGILDFYHAAQHLWRAASAYHNGNPARTPQQWFEQMRHRLRHGFGKPLIRELHQLSRYRSTSDDTRVILRQVRDYFKTHLEHIQYRKFKKLNLPIGSGMVESACKWLIQQRFKGVGMRWSEDGFNHLLHLRLAWINGRFDFLFGEQLSLPLLYSPKR